MNKRRERDWRVAERTLTCTCNREIPFFWLSLFTQFNRQKIGWYLSKEYCFVMGVVYSVHMFFSLVLISCSWKDINYENLALGSSLDRTCSAMCRIWCVKLTNVSVCILHVVEVLYNWSFQTKVMRIFPEVIVNVNGHRILITVLFSFILLNSICYFLNFIVSWIPVWTGKWRCEVCGETAGSYWKTATRKRKHHKIIWGN